MRFPLWTVVLVITALTVGVTGPARGTEDLFAAMGVQPPANSSPAPDIVFPSLDGRTVHIKDFRGKVVLLAEEVRALAETDGNLDTSGRRS